MSAGRKMLLHCCCAPCSTAAIDFFIPDYQVAVFFYNPNIYSVEEYAKRLAEQKRYCLIKGVPFIEKEYRPQDFFSAAEGLENEKEGGKRCEKCIAFRLESAARYAKDNCFDCFASSLSVSPHKNARFINETGIALQRAVGVAYVESDLKKNDGFKKSVEISKKYNIYRQNYCGCLYSIHE